MSLRIQEVRKGSQISENVKCLMQAVFPEDELVSYRLLLDLSEQDGVSFQAFFDEDSFCGLAYWMEHDGLVYLLYLAVAPTVQSKGYGTQILNSLKLQNPGKTIMLEAESVREAADNASQRRRRIAFYEKNGFEVLDFRANDDGRIYDALAFAGRPSGADFIALLEHFSPEMASAVQILD